MGALAAALLLIGSVVVGTPTPAAWASQGPVSLTTAPTGSVSTGSIEGTFIKAEPPQGPLVDYEAVLRNSARELTTTRTDDKGHFRFDGLAPGSYTLYANNGNYIHDYGDVIQVTAGGMTSIRLVVPYAWANWVQWADQIYGADRYATAAELSRVSHNPGVRVAFIASGTTFADALTAAPAAARWDSPLLLTAPGELPQSVATELQRLKPQKIVVVGGEIAVSAAVQKQLAAWAPLVERVAGADRYETAVRVAQTQFDECPSLHVATGRAFPDALSAGSRAGRYSGPLLLLDGSQAQIPDSVAAYVAEAGCRSAVVVGGPTVLPETLTEDLGRRLEFGTKRIGGSDRYETSRLAAAGASTYHVYVASGENFPDALAAAAQAGHVKAPLYLASKTCLSPAIQRDIRAASQGQFPAEVTTVGGPNVIWKVFLDQPGSFRC